MIPKPRPQWDLDIGSPWAGQSLRPTVWEVALAYPGVAFGELVGAALLSLVPAGLITYALDWVIDTVTGVSLISVLAPEGAPTRGVYVLLVVVWLSSALGLWWVEMYGLIRGWKRYEQRSD
jgi:hypothetical protein